jgi:hypothetical protein
MCAYHNSFAESTWIPEYLCRKKSNICNEVDTETLTALFSLTFFCYLVSIMNLAIYSSGVVCLD